MAHQDMRGHESVIALNLEDVVPAVVPAVVDAIVPVVEAIDHLRAISPGVHEVVATEGGADLEIPAAAHFFSYSGRDGGGSWLPLPEEFYMYECTSEPFGIKAIIRNGNGMSMVPIEPGWDLLRFFDARGSGKTSKVNVWFYP